MSKLHILNFFILQWFTLRLAKVYEDGTFLRWELMHGVKPMSGYRNDKFIYLWGHRA